MSSHRAQILTQTLTLLSNQFPSSTFTTRIQQLLHTQFLKTLTHPPSQSATKFPKLSHTIFQQPYPLQHQNQSQPSSYLDMVEYQIDKDKFVPSQALLVGFQELYPFSINQVEKVIADKMVNVFGDTNGSKKKIEGNIGQINSNGFGGSGNKDSMWGKPWIVEKREIGWEEMMRKGREIGQREIEIGSEGKGFNERYYEEIQYSKRNEQQVPENVNKLEEREDIKVSKGQKQRQVNNQTKGLDYWKKKRQQMSKTFK